MRQARGPSPGGKGLLPPHWEEGVTGDQADSQGASLLIEEELGPQWSPPTARRTDWGSLPLQAPSRRTRGGAVPGGQQGCGWRRGAAPGRGREGAAAQRARRSGRGQPGLSGGPWGPSVPALALQAPDMSLCGPLNWSLAGEATTCSAPGIPNVSAVPPLGGTGGSPALPIFSMTLGAVSNVLALALLAQAAGRLRRRRSAATFLLFVASLLAIDLAGHVIPGALVLRLYAAGRAPAGGACHFLGGCMVFFGLCPLLLGCGMAVERCVGVTWPLLHAARVSVARARFALAALAAVALAVALLPLARVGRYELQYPGTWCFIGLGPPGGWRQP
ncbi:prostaglandin E2 receptor EP1 subtype [Marmota marmota marmota]|uniref:prostaglandin E2 receptor EP1 subtype n=1 Tax=Marmota marmota marmota TaxID=9994 RepID=UPI002093A675|nr:prostaglandin E2 receptor EP1 subtype [Marmota marmota marmota]